MTGQVNFLELFKQLKTEDFLKFLDGVGVTTNCVMCGHEVTIVSETSKSSLASPDSTTEYATLFRHNTVINTDHPQNYYYRIHCELCGFDSTFAAVSVFNWLQVQHLKEQAEDTK